MNALATPAALGTAQACPVQVGQAAELTVLAPAQLLVAAFEAAAHLEDCARFAHASMHDQAAASLRASAARLRSALALAVEGAAA